MSMISAQIDELRNAAEFYDGFQAANLMREAADTIWELRDDLQRANAENAKLRELCATVIDDWMSKVCPSFPFCEFGGEYQDCTDETCGNQIYRQMARELGVDE